jgi:hypothetical protein
MLTFLNFAISALTFFVAVSAIWLAVWSYRRLSITVFIWIAATKLVRAASTALWLAPISEKAPQVVNHLEALAEQTDAPLGQLFLSILYFSQLFPLVVTVLLAVIAVTEATHLMSRADPAFVQGPVFLLAYRIRWVFGLIAVLAAIAPSLIFAYILQSLP